MVWRGPGYGLLSLAGFTIGADGAGKGRMEGYTNVLIARWGWGSPPSQLPRPAWHLFSLGELLYRLLACLMLPHLLRMWRGGKEARGQHTMRLDRWGREPAFALHVHLAWSPYGKMESNWRWGVVPWLLAALIFVKCSVLTPDSWFHLSHAHTENNSRLLRFLLKWQNQTWGRNKNRSLWPRNWMNCFKFTHL